MPYPWDAPAAFFLLLSMLRLCDWFFAQGLQNPHEYDHDDQLHLVWVSAVCCMGRSAACTFFESFHMLCHIRGYTPENPCAERKDDVEQYPENKILGRLVDATCSRKHCQDLYMQIFRYKHIY